MNHNTELPRTLSIASASERCRLISKLVIRWMRSGKMGKMGGFDAARLEAIKQVEAARPDLAR